MFYQWSLVVRMYYVARGDVAHLFENSFRCKNLHFTRQTWKKNHWFQYQLFRTPIMKLYNRTWLFECRGWKRRRDLLRHKQIYGTLTFPRLEPTIHLKFKEVHTVHSNKAGFRLNFCDTNRDRLNKAMSYWILSILIQAWRKIFKLWKWG